MNNEVFEQIEASIDAMSDKDDLLAIFLWEKLLSMDGIPEDARTYANQVIDLYRARLGADSGAGEQRTASAGDDDDCPDGLDTWGLNIMLRHFIWNLEDIERLGVSDDVHSRIARCIRIYRESIVG